MEISRITASSLLFLIYLTSGISAGTTPLCTDRQEMAALSEASRLSTWDGVYKSFKRYRHCDDGAISEGYSDTIGRLLADDWKTFQRLRKLCATDKKFLDFVLKHIDLTIPSDVLQRIIENTQLQCPQEAQGLCNKIKNKAAADWNK